MYADEKDARALSSNGAIDEDEHDEDEVEQADQAEAEVVDLTELVDEALPPMAGISSQGLRSNAHEQSGFAAQPNPFDPMGIGKASFEVAQAMLANPQSLIETQMKFANAWLETAQRSMTPIAERGNPVIEPAANDARFKHPAWTDNSVFAAIKEGYLLATKAMLDGIDAAEIDPDTKARVKFFAKQFCDMMSPTNFAFLNPAVLEETMKTGGENLQRGAQNVLEDIRDNQGRPALVDKKAFTVGKNVATTPGAVVYRNELIELIEYNATTETVYQKPLVIVPPWINKYYILDLQPKNSIIKFAVDSGIRTYVVSWRNPDKSMADVGWEHYLDRGPLRACRVASAIAKSQDVNLIGYCIGGTLTAEMLAYLGRSEEILINAITFFAALTDFAEAGDLRAFLSREAIETIEQKMDEKGVLDSSEMADTFNMLRANDLIWNVAVNRYLLGKDAPAFDLLYWNGDATRLPRAMHRYYLRNMYLENNLAKRDVLTYRGVPIDLRRVRNDVYSVATIDDHIAPWRSVYRMTQLFSGDVRFRLGHSGHIAGIINPPTSGKGHYWSAPSNPPNPDDWLAQAEKTQGSWWPDWMAWLTVRSGERVPARDEPGSKHFKAKTPAPGKYVMEK
jgi:polyhydroxyalkanoate synthase